MERCDELAAFRIKIWDRYVTLRSQYGTRMPLSFDQFWYDFLARHMISDSGVEQVYEDFCNNWENLCLRNVHDSSHRWEGGH